MDREHLDTAIQQIRDYTNEHLELRAAHHFLYDLPLDRKAGKPEVVIMGVNPGETEYDRRAYPGPTEQTYYHDFHEKATSGRSRANRNWNRNAVFFANGKSVVFTEMFFWSSGDGEELKQRYGSLWESRHLSFCIAMNRLLIGEYRPQSVIFTGLSHWRRVANAFDLEHVRTVRDGRWRLVEHYQDGFRPWFITKHWSGSFGFSNDQKDAIRQYMRMASASNTTAS